MADQSYAREQIRRYGIMRPPAQELRLRAVLIAWALHFGLLTFLPGMWRRVYLGGHPKPRRVAAGVLLSAMTLVLLDAFFRGWSRQLGEIEETRDRLRAELGREPSTEEAAQAWADEHGHPWLKG